MLRSNTEERVRKAEGLLGRLKKIRKFSGKYQIAPVREAKQVALEMQELASSLEEIPKPKNQDELIQSELKRRMNGEATYLEQGLSGRLYDFDTVIGLLGIPRKDIDSLRPWLEQNKEKTQAAIERLFHSRDIEGFELPLAEDVPSIRRQAEEFSSAHIQRYHKTLGKFLQGITNVGEFIRDINAVASTNERSYFQPLTNTLAIGIPAICYSTEDCTLHIKDREMIRLYGHEGMGHALNYMVTRSNSLPHFLTEDSALTVATAESVALHYENILLEDLRKSPETQRRLGIEHKFAGIYQEAKDTEQVGEYKRRLAYYSISVLSDKSLGEQQDPATLNRKVQRINEVAIDPSQAMGFVQSNRYNFDSEGNLNSSIVGELRYCARPVPRAIDEFSKKGIDYFGEGRSLIDSTMLKGLWTPIGFVDNARLVAEEYSSKK